MSSAFKSALHKKNEQKKQMKNSSIFEKDRDMNGEESSSESDKNEKLTKKVKKQLKKST